MKFAHECFYLQSIIYLIKCKSFFSFCKEKCERRFNYQNFHRYFFIPRLSHRYFFIIYLFHRKFHVNIFSFQIFYLFSF